eukprot:SAG11_NODE_1311_length_5234_cov_4.354820_4_plen_71_part_00
MQIEDAEEYEEILEDMQEECSKFGECNLVMPREMPVRCSSTVTRFCSINIACCCGMLSARATMLHTNTSE